MKKSGDKDFLTVLQSLETILQAQTKISKQQLSSRTQNSKASSSPKKSNKKNYNLSPNIDLLLVIFKNDKIN